MLSTMASKGACTIIEPVNDSFIGQNLLIVSRGHETFRVESTDTRYIDRSHTTSQHVIVKCIGISVSKTLLSLRDRIDRRKVCLWCLDFWLAKGDFTYWFDEQVSLHLVGELIRGRFISPLLIRTCGHHGWNREVHIRT